MSKQLRVVLGCARCGATVLRVDGPKPDDSGRPWIWYGPLYTEGGLSVWPVTVNPRNGRRKILRQPLDPNPTYSWDCGRCGHPDTCTHERILTAWSRLFFRADDGTWYPRDTQDPDVQRVLQFRIGTDL